MSLNQLQQQQKIAQQIFQRGGQDQGLDMNKEQSVNLQTFI